MSRMGVLMNRFVNPWPRKQIRISTNRRSRGAQDVLAARTVMNLIVRSANRRFAARTVFVEVVRGANWSVKGPILSCLELCDVEIFNN